MRRLLAAVALIMSLTGAFPAAAERFGPIDIVSLPAFGAPQYGRYYEYRFHVTNRSNDPHAVRLEVRTGAHERDGATSRTLRTFHLAPRSSAVVQVPQLLTTSYTADEARVQIDGRGEREKVVMKGESVWGDEEKILASRSVLSDAAPLLSFHRTALAPSEWSPNWLQYARFESAVIAARDWSELPPPVRTALLRWTAAGGWLLFLGAPEEGLPALRPGSDGSHSFHGLGRVSIVPEGPVPPALQAALEVWQDSHTRGLLQSSGDLPLLKGNVLPVRSLFGLLLAFVVIGGPLHLYVLARKSRRIWVFWTLPLLSIVASVALVGATILDEGWVRVHRSLALTLLDETRGEAATIGESGIYATMAPRGEVVFDAETEIRPSGYVRNGDTETDDGQRLFGSWVGTRVPTYFSVRKSEPRRERLPVRSGPVGPVAVNGLGAHIDRLWVATPDGSVWTAVDVSAGKEVWLTRSKKDPVVRAVVVDVAERLSMLGTWSSVVAIAENDPAVLLRPGMYVAITRDGPFMSVPLERPTTSSARGVIIGFMKKASERGTP